MDRENGYVEPFNSKLREILGAFLFSAAKNKVSRNIVEKVFEQLAAFAAYGFCKAHFAITYCELRLGGQK
ncbi:hypothetical protein ACFLX0_01365 [Chloroflexota bacterium]